jgi:hypothetical protein
MAAANSANVFDSAGESDDAICACCGGGGASGMIASTVDVDELAATEVTLVRGADDFAVKDDDDERRSCC